MIDPDRRPTPFQWRVLHIVRAEGPISIAGIQKRMHQQGNDAIRSACWILRCGGYLTSDTGQLDVSAAGRYVLALHRDSKPRPPLRVRLLDFVRSRLRYQPLADHEDCAGAS